MTRVTHVIDGLSVGGAEVMLANLLRTTDLEEFPSEVISLTDVGPVGASIEAMGVPVREVGLRPRPAGALAGARLPQLLRAGRPDLVQTWLYHGDLLGGIAARLFTRHAPVIWGVHRSDLDPAWTKRRLALTAKLCGLLSGPIPACIICCSTDAADRHVALGYDRAKIEIVPNGFDLGAYAPSPDAARSVREELGVGATAPLVGMIARFDPQKDHLTFLRAAAELTREVPSAHFVLAGKEVTPDNPTLAGFLAAHPALEGRVHLLGLRGDIARIDAALSVGVLSSIGGEAFPLAIGEAMAAGVPCVVTDVGDAGELVGDTGRVVPRQDAAGIAAAVAGLLHDEPARQELGRAARRRVEEHYELGQVVARYEAIYRRVVAG